MNSSIRRFLIPAVTIVLLAGLSAALLTPRAPANTGAAGGSGPPAPGFTLSTLDGQRVTLEQFKGKPLVLTFFASWCGPCKEGAPMLAQAARDFKDVNFLGIAYNDQLERARQFRDTYDLGFAVALDDSSDAGRSSVKYALLNVPQTFFIDQNGLIKRHDPRRITRTDLEAGLKTIGGL